MAGLKTASNDPATTSTLARLDKVRGFVVDNDTGRPVSGVAVLATVELDGGRQIPIGTLASDAAGYVSFDLRGTIGEASPMQVCVTPVGDEPAALTLGCTGTTPSDLTLPFVLRVHGLGGAGCSGCEDEAGARPLAVQIPDLPAVQNPDLLDWRISPSSFAISRPLVLGDSTCQMLVPAEGAKFATNTYRFIQVVRRAVTTGMATAGKRGSYGSDAGPVQAAASVLADLVSGALTSEERAVPPAGAVRQPPPGSDTPHSATTVVGVAFDTSRNPELGQVLSFRQTWSPLTHSLGKIAYSLPLAPCESVNIAVIDWSRGDQAVRNDQAKSTENLVHSQRRDRSIDEAVDSALSESQGGWSLQAGLGGAVRSSASGTVPIEGVDVSMSAGQGLVGGFGYGTAQSWGERDLTGSSLQDLHDSIVQATSVVRQLNSTVVVQSSQQERNYVETRTVTNHNHCHALTVQYHEVLQHLQVDTRYEGRRWAVLIPYKLLNFDWQLALRYRTILETVLLDRRLAACFDAIFRLQYCQEAYPAPADKPKDIGGGGTVSSGGATKGVHGATPVQPGVTRYELVLGTGDRNTWGKIWVYLGLKDGSWKLLHFKDRKQEGGEEIWANTEYVKDISSGAAIGVDPTQIERIKVSWFEADGGDEWLFKGIRIRYQLYGQTGLDPSPVIDEHKLPYLVDFNDSWGQVKDWIGEVKPPKPTVSDTPMAAASDLAGQPTMPAYNKLDDQCCQQQLLVHLQANVGYYSRACWLLQDPTERVMMLDALFATVPAVRNAIDPTPLAINGNYVTYGFNGATAPEPTPSPELAPKRDIVSLPTRGLFAETHLSNCSACEQRDVTRFWNWEESPCPDKAPDITQITPGPKGQATTVQPAALPSPVVQVMNAPNEPDPTGLAAAFKLLATPDIFRDMSTQTEVSKLLDGLVSGSVNLAQAKEMAAKAKQGSASGATGTGIGGSKRSAPNESNAGNQIDKLDAIKYAQSKDLINEAAASNAAEGVLGGDLLASSDAGVVQSAPPPGRPPEKQILDEVTKRPRLKESFDALVGQGFEIRLAPVSGGTFSVDLSRRLLLIKDINVSFGTSADWVEGAVKRTFQLDEALRRTAISDKARAIFNVGGINDLEKMARVYEWSVWFWQFPQLNGNNVIQGLMGDMMVVLTELPESANPLSTNDGKFRIFGMTGGAFAENSGFKKMFRDDSNQVRHATFSLQVSLLYGSAGFKGAQQREDDNTADCRLNVACKRIADGLKGSEASFQAADFGEIIRRELGDPSEVGPWKGPADGDPVPLCSTKLF